MPRMTDAYEWSGRVVVDVDGEEIGKIDAIYRNSSTDEPAWAAVRAGTIRRHTVIVPLGAAAPRGEDVGIVVRKDTIDEAPEIEPGDGLTAADEERLLAHYGL
jgi:hypothetical protein